MRTSSGVVIGSTLVLVTALATPASSQPQPVFDHLKCYKVREIEKRKVKGLVDLIPLQTQFLPEKDCKIVGPRWLCVPVSKQNVRTEPPPPGAPDGPEQIDHICYTLSCRKPFPPPVMVTDQFGTFTLQPTGTNFLCTPARKGGPITTTTTTSSTSTIPTTTTSSTTTTTTRPPEPCRDQTGGTGAPACAGDCPATTPKCVFVPAAGTCECVPNDQMCMPQGTTGQCGGLCPNATDVCVPNAVGGCDCQPQLDCQASEPPACGGICPPGLVCRQPTPTAGCQCLDPAG